MKKGRKGASIQAAPVMMNMMSMAPKPRSTMMESLNDCMEVESLGNEKSFGIQ